MGLAQRAFETLSDFFRPSAEGSQRVAAAAPAPLAALPPPAGRSRAAGVGGTAIVGKKIKYEEWNSSLENDKGYGAWSRQGVYDQMRRTDPSVARALLLVKLPLLAANWAIEPGGESDLHKEQADFVASNLFEDLSWIPFLWQILTLYDFGFSLFEPLTDVCEVPRARFPNLPTTRAPGRPAKGERVPSVRWTAFAPRLQKTVYGWVAREDREGCVGKVIQWVGSDDKQTPGYREIPGERLLRFTYQQEGANFQGVPIMRPAYKPWKILDVLERIDAIRHERQNVGIPIITLPDGAVEDDVAKAESILQSLSSHEKGYIILPAGWQFKWEVSGHGEGTHVGERIDQVKRDIADTVLAGFMALGNGDTGSYALADTQADQYLSILTLGARLIENAFNVGVDAPSVIRALIDANYGPQDAYPQLRAKNLKSQDDWGKILPLVSQLLTSKGLRASPKLERAILERLGLTEAALDEAEEAELEEAEPAPEEEAPEDAPADDEATPETEPDPAEKEAPDAP